MQLGPICRDFQQTGFLNFQIFRKIDRIGAIGRGGHSFFQHFPGGRSMQPGLGACVGAQGSARWSSGQLKTIGSFVHDIEVLDRVEWFWQRTFCAEPNHLTIENRLVCVASIRDLKDR